MDQSDGSESHALLGHETISYSFQRKFPAHIAAVIHDTLQSLPIRPLWSRLDDHLVTVSRLQRRIADVVPGGMKYKSHGLSQAKKQVERETAEGVIGSTKAKPSATQHIISKAIDGYNPELRAINKKIFDNPELGYEEVQAHDNIVALLRSLGFKVTPHAYGVETSFAAEYGSGGRVVAFNAEYDALPGIGHACGHNLIATSSIAAFLGLAAALKASKISGRVRLLGTPAEEGGGGKIKLIDAGAYADVDACMMVHPGPPAAAARAAASSSHAAHGNQENPCCFTGQAYGKTLANKKFNARYTGRPAHAALAPYQGLNALDAVVLAYNGVSMLRQQTHSYDRIHSVIMEGGTRPNVITSASSSQYYVRSRTLAEATTLQMRVKKCLDGAAVATGCEVDYEAVNEYADLRPNRSICSLYAEAMAELGSPVMCDFDSDEPGLGSTDQGNVTYVCPAFHGMYSIPCPPGAFNHTPGFTACAGTDEAHDLTIATSKGMAVAGWRVLSDDAVASQIWRDFEDDQKALSDVADTN